MQVAASRGVRSPCSPQHKVQLLLLNCSICSAVREEGRSPTEPAQPQAGTFLPLLCHHPEHLGKPREAQEHALGQACRVGQAAHHPHDSRDLQLMKKHLAATADLTRALHNGKLSKLFLELPLPQTGALASSWLPVMFF